MHDAGNCCNDLNVPLTQGKGATIWASEEEQKKRPCFVLAPLYPEKTAEDDFTVTWEADATLELIKELAKQYPIDASRIYGTGQSMGCMMLLRADDPSSEIFCGVLPGRGAVEPGHHGGGERRKYLGACLRKGTLRRFRSWVPA